MAPRTVLVVDDEAPARARLLRLLEDIGDWHVVGEAAQGHQALEMCQQLDPELVLLDIRMPGMDGIEVARHLSKLEQPPAVVFTTAYDAYAIQAFEAQAIGYLLKPVRRERLEKALEHAGRLSRGGAATLAGAAAPRSHICVRKAKGLRLVPVREIVCFQADQKYVTLVHREGEEITDETLKALETEFAAEFVRIHRNTLVAIAYLQRIETTDDGHALAWVAHYKDPLPISRRLIADVRRRLLNRPAANS